MNQYFKSLKSGRIYQVFQNVGTSSDCTIIKCNFDDSTLGIKIGQTMVVRTSNLVPLSPQELHELKTELAGNKI